MSIVGVIISLIQIACIYFALSDVDLFSRGLCLSVLIAASYYDGFRHRGKLDEREG